MICNHLECKQETLKAHANSSNIRWRFNQNRREYKFLKLRLLGKKTCLLNVIVIYIRILRKENERKWRNHKLMSQEQSEQWRR